MHRYLSLRVKATPPPFSPHTSSPSSSPLQAASKHEGGLVHRYLSLCITEKGRRLEADQEGTLDLQQYVQYKKNHRCGGECESTCMGG